MKNIMLALTLIAGSSTFVSAETNGSLIDGILPVEEVAYIRTCFWAYGFYVCKYSKTIAG